MSGYKRIVGGYFGDFSITVIVHNNEFSFQFSGFLRKKQMF